MKTTMMFRTIANPRRTTLAHLADAETLQEQPWLPEHSAVLPAQTANPRRTVLLTVPQAGADGELPAAVPEGYVVTQGAS